MVSKTIPLESAAEAVPDLDGDEPVEVSVLIPVTERPEPLVALYEEYAAPIRALGVRYEFIFAAEPWFRELTQPLATLAAAGEPVRAVVVDQTTGETRLLKAAAAFCRGPVVLTLPAYRRIEASALPDLIACIHEGADLAVARRWPRRDPWINRIQNRILHRIIGRLADDRIHDVACGVRAFRREVLLEMPLYGDFSRFLPIFAQRDGYRVEELAVPQHPADARARIYGPGVYLRRVIDLLNLFFLLRFTDKPLRFFGMIGIVLGMIGSAILLVLLGQRLGGQGIADRPFLLLGVLFVVVGAQAIALGLIGEIIVHLHAPARKPYRIARSTTTARD